MRKVAFMLVMAGVLVMPNVSSAQTVESLQAQIAALTAMIQQLQAQLTQAQGGGATQWCHDFKTNLRIDNQENQEDVLALHKALIKEGLLSDYYASQNFEGSTYFSETTASAVTSFQEKYRDEILTPSGLKNGTGYVGPSTRKKLNQLYGCSTGSNQGAINYSQPTITSQYPQTTTSLQPSIRVLSPNGGEVISAGSTHTISWKSTRVLNFYITYTNLDTRLTDYVVSNVLAVDTAISTDVDGSQSNAYTWNVPSTLTPGNYEIVVANAAWGAATVADSSDSRFVVTAPAATTSGSAASFAVTRSAPLSDGYRVPSETTQMLLSSFDISVPNAANGFTLSSIKLKTGYGVGPGGFAVQNLYVYVNQTGGKGTYFGQTQAVVGSPAVYTYYGSLPVTGSTANIQIFGDIASAVPATYISPFSIGGATGVMPDYAAINFTGNVSGNNITVISAQASTPNGFITVLSDTSNPPANSLVMGSTGNTLAAFRFSETSNTSDVRIADITIKDAVSSVSAVLPSFRNLCLYQATTIISCAGGPAIDNGSYAYTFHPYNAIVVAKGQSVVLTLKGDVEPYPSAGASDNSIHQFSIIAIGGLYSGASLTPSGLPPSGNPMTVLRTKLTVTATPHGSTSGRGISSVDDLGEIKFAADSAGALKLNEVTITLSGSGLSTMFYNTAPAGWDGWDRCSDCYVVLYDPANGRSYSPVSSNAVNKTLTFDLNGFTISNGSYKDFTLRLDDRALRSGVTGVSLTLSATIASAGDVKWTDAVVGDVSGLSLPAGTILPININSVSYTAGAGGSAATAATAPSITLNVSSGNRASDTGISVNIGDTFAISGTPQNLQGMSYYYGSGYPTSGYYNRAYIFDQTFGNNNLCGNNEATATGVWTMTCTAKIPGSSTFYIEIYANGQTYRSNTVAVTVSATTLAPTAAISAVNTEKGVYISWSSTNAAECSLYDSPGDYIIKTGSIVSSRPGFSGTFTSGSLTASGNTTYGYGCTSSSGDTGWKYVRAYTYSAGTATPVSYSQYPKCSCDVSQARDCASTIVSIDQGTVCYELYNAQTDSLGGPAYMSIPYTRGSGGTSSASTTVTVAGVQGAQQIPNNAKQTANMLQVMTALLQNMLKLIR